MDSRGISPVVASILLVLVVISMAGGYLVFTQRTAQQQTEAAERQSQEVTQSATTTFHIQRVSGQTAVIRNDGLETLPNNSLTVLIDNQRHNYAMDGPIESEETGEVVIEELWRSGRGDHQLKASGASHSDTALIEIKPREQGRVADWRFEAGSGDTAFDYSDNGNDGTLGGGNSTEMPGWVDGRFGGALEFDGVNDYVRIRDDDSIDFTNSDFTVSLWMRTSMTTRGTIVAKKLGTGSGRPGYHVTTSNDGNNVNTDIADGTDQVRVRSRDFNDGAFHHVTVIANRDGLLSLYFDGTLEDTVDMTIIGDIDNTLDLFVGTESDTDNPFDGTIDEPLIYDRALEPDQLYVMSPR